MNRPLPFSAACLVIGVLALGFLVLGVLVAPLGAQTANPPPSAPPAPTSPAPLPAPAAPVSPVPTSPPAAQAAPVTPDMEKPSADASTAQLITLEARPVLKLSGKSSWDDGFATLKTRFRQLEDEAKRLNAAISARPQAYFIESDDLGFTYEAYLIIDAPLKSGEAPRDGVETGLTPAGKTMMFAHESPYDDIDSAYEAIAAYLDEKGLIATGKFLEEYTHLPETSDDPGMKIKIYVFLK